MTSGRLMLLLPNGSAFWSTPVTSGLFNAFCIGPDGSGYLGTSTSASLGVAPFEVTRIDANGVLQ